MPDELEIDAVEQFGMTRLGQVRSAPTIIFGELVDGPPPPLTFADVPFVGLAARPEGWRDRGALFTVTRDGFLRVDCANGRWIYELFPARWSDGNGGPVYVCAWRD